MTIKQVSENALPEVFIQPPEKHIINIKDFFMST